MLRFMRAYVAAVHRAKTDEAFSIGVNAAVHGHRRSRLAGVRLPPVRRRLAASALCERDGLQGVIDSLVASNPHVAKVDPTTLVNPSLLRELDANGYIGSLYSR